MGPKQEAMLPLPVHITPGNRGENQVWKRHLLHMVNFYLIFFPGTLIYTAVMVIVILSACKKNPTNKEKKGNKINCCDRRHIYCITWNLGKSVFPVQEGDGGREAKRRGITNICGNCQQTQTLWLKRRRGAFGFASERRDMA